MSKYMLLDYARFPDCSALTENGKCTRLNVFKCQGEKCSFKKSQKEDSDSMQYCYKRISNLDSFAQTHIAQKYFCGSMPWKEK